MKIYKTEFPGLLLIEPKVFSDQRGYFFESYNKSKFDDEGLKLNFVQDNISKSVYGTIRGLHFQINPFAQGKLCQVIKGEVLDVVVDLRKGSPTYGKHYSVVLSEENHLQLWVPEGFAHGFSVLSEEAVFHYKCTNFYNRDSERVIRFNDPDLKINWQIDNPIVSEKDMQGLLLSDIPTYFTYQG